MDDSSAVEEVNVVLEVEDLLSGRVIIELQVLL